MKSIFLIAIVSLCTGCGPRASNLYSISLEKTEGAIVLKREKQDLDQLLSSYEIPTEYSIKRESYTLHFSIGNYGELSYFPHLMFSAEHLDGYNLAIKPDGTNTPRADRGNICANYRPYSTSDILFTWQKNCLEKKYMKYIYFDVIGDNGKVLANEKIPFSIIKSGIYYFIDSL